MPRTDPRPPSTEPLCSSKAARATPDGHRRSAGGRKLTCVHEVYGPDGIVAGRTPRLLPLRLRLEAEERTEGANLSSVHVEALGCPATTSHHRGSTLGIREVLEPHRSELLSAAVSRGFSHVRVFGSVRRGEATEKSDVDLLVDRDEGASLLDRAALTRQLERVLRRKVDVIPEESPPAAEGFFT